MENFEHEAKQRLEQYESPINSTKMWAHIDAELRPAPKRRIGWLWISLGVAGALTTLLIARQYQRYVQVINTNPYATPSTPTPQATEQISTNIYDFAASPNQNVSEQAQTNIQDNSVANSNNKNNHTNNLPETLRANATAAPKAAASTITINPKSTPLVSASAPLIAAFKATTTIPEPSTTNASNASKTNNLESLDLLKIGAIPTNVVHKDEKKTLDLVPNAAAKPNINCYDWRPKPQIYGGVYLGASYPFKSLQAHRKEDEAYADLRKSKESVLESVQGGLFLGVITPKKILVEAGLEYNRINERFRSTTTTIDTIARYEIIGWIIKPNGDTTFVRDSVFVSETTTTTATIYNNFQFYNIPIAFGYEFGSPKSRLRPYLKGGVAINIAMSYKSGILDPTGNINIFESSGNTTNTPFRTRIGAIPFAAVGARMSLNERVDAFGELNYRYHLRNVTLDNYLLQQRYSLLGLNIGLSMRF